MAVELLEKVSLALKNKNIPYLVIGGQAVLVYGRPRMTDDIDIIINAMLMNKNFDRKYIIQWLEKFDEDPELNLMQKYLQIENEVLN